MCSESPGQSSHSTGGIEPSSTQQINSLGYVIPDLTGQGDESQKVQDAVDYAYQNGWPVVFPPGTYTLGGIVLPGEGVKITGSSQGRTRLVPAQGSQWIIQTRSYCVIRDLQFYLAGENTVAIDVFNTSRALIDNLGLMHV